MGNFFKNVLSVMVGSWLAWITVFFLFIIFAIAMGSGDDEVYVKDNSVLRISLSEVITEMGQENEFEPEAILGEDAPRKLSLIRVIEAMKHAAFDDRIKGVFLDITGVNAGFVTLTEIRDAIASFKETSGKFVYAYGDYYSEGGYYVASVADSIFLHPMGAVELNGLRVEPMFYKGMFDKFSIKAEVFRVGTFKSAVEPYFLEQMSPESRYQAQIFLDSLNNYMLAKIASSRNIAFDSLKSISNNMLVRNSATALQYGLASRITYRDEMDAALREKLEISSKTSKLPFISLGKYIKAEKEHIEEKEVEDKIAVIIADGQIIDGKGDIDMVGGDFIAKQIKKAREDDKVKAIVLRINSPGGSAFASDVMWREVKLTKGVKPIIASMGDVAASGGYYLAMACDTIVAMPNTITGSIGIFGVLFDTEQMFKENLGITFDEVNTGAFSNLGSFTNEYSDAERAIIQAGVNEGYETFTSKAAEGRGMPLDSLKKLAEGRVWIGADAKRIGLVDVLGNYNDALEIAANSAGLADYQITYLHPSPENPFEKIFNKEKEAKEAIQKELGALYPIYEQLQQLQYTQGVQAKAPFVVRIK